MVVLLLRKKNRLCMDNCYILYIHIIIFFLQWSGVFLFAIWCEDDDAVCGGMLICYHSCSNNLGCWELQYFSQKDWKEMIDLHFHTESPALFFLCIDLAYCSHWVAVFNIDGVYYTRDYWTNVSVMSVNKKQRSWTDRGLWAPYLPLIPYSEQWRVRWGGL